jgi:hypothetical protein
VYTDEFEKNEREDEEPEPLKAADLVEVWSVQGDVEAEILRGFLESNGINCLLSSDIPHSVYPFSIDGLGEVRVLVRPDNARDALRLLEDAQYYGEPIESAEEFFDEFDEPPGEDVDLDS